MSLRSDFDEPNLDAHWYAACLPLEVEAMIQQLLAQGYILSTHHHEQISALLQCRAASAGDIIAILTLPQHIDDTDYRLGWSSVFLA